MQLNFRLLITLEKLCHVMIFIMFYIKHNIEKQFSLLRGNSLIIVNILIINIFIL